MPFIMSYTDPGGTLHSNSYWIASAISYNALLKTGQIIFQGYHDEDSYNAGAEQIAGSPRALATTDPAIFDQYFGNARRVSSGLAFEAWLESFAQNEDVTFHFFELAIRYAPVEVLILEIGDVNKTTITLIFTDEVTSNSSDYSLGITIRVNGTPVTPSIAAKQVNTSIWYTIGAVDADDVIDWEYDSSIGDLVNNSGDPIQSLGRLTVANQVGVFARFNVAENSGLLLTL